MAITRRFDGYDFKAEDPETPLLAYVWETDGVSPATYRQLFATEQDADDHQAIAESTLQGT